MPDLLLKDLVDHPLECFFGILQFEGCHLVAVHFPIGGECHLVFILRMYIDLVVPRIGIHEA